MKTTLLAVVAASLATTLAVAPAQAQDVRVQVSHADLDINSAAGAAALATRIETGVAQACARSSDIRDLTAVTLCKEAMISDAVAQLNAKGATAAAAKLSANG